MGFTNNILLLKQRNICRTILNCKRSLLTLPCPPIHTYKVRNKQTVQTNKQTNKKTVQGQNKERNMFT